MKRKFPLVLACSAAALAAVSAVPFLPRIDPPPPPRVVYPANWTNELELAEAACSLVSETTNLLGVCWFSEEIGRLRLAGDTEGANAVRAQWARERDALVKHWIDDFRTNGIPDKYKR